MVSLSKLYKKTNANVKNMNRTEVQYDNSDHIFRLLHFKFITFESILIGPFFAKFILRRLFWLPTTSFDRFSSAISSDECFPQRDF